MLFDFFIENYIIFKLYIYFINFTNMDTLKDILTWLFTNWLWDFIKVISKFLFWGVVLWWLWFLLYKSYNKNITIWNKSEVAKSFNSKANQDIDIWKWTKIDGSFNS